MKRRMNILIESPYQKRINRFTILVRKQNIVGPSITMVQHIKAV